MTPEITVDYTKFNVAHLTFTKLEENSRSKGQLIAYPKYNTTNSEKDGILILQSPWIKLNTYGVPRLGEYYKTDADRSHLRIPLDLDIQEVKNFSDKMKEIDAKYSSPEMLEEMFGKKYKKYKYQPIYREGQDATSNESDNEEENDEKEKKNAPLRPPYMKLKLDTTWPDNEVKTQVFNSTVDSLTNKRSRTLIENIKTIDDFAKYVSYLSNIRAMFRPVKFWAHQATKKDPQCGIIFKLIKVEVEPRISSNSMYKQIYENDNFIDSDNDDESLPKSLPKLSINTQKNDDDDDDDDEDDEPLPKSKLNIQKNKNDDDDEEDEPLPKSKLNIQKNKNDDNKTQSVKQTKNIVTVDSDDDSDDDNDKLSKTKPLEKVLSKNNNNSDESDDSDDSDNHKSLESVKKTATIVQVESDDESSDEEIIVKNTKNKKITKSKK